MTKTEPRDRRAHRVLFDRNTPFRPRQERVRVAYQRQPKHRAREAH